MHEVSIMHTVFDLALKVMQEQAARRIYRIHLRVGALSGVVPEALTFAFEALKVHTAAAEATLEIQLVPARLFCPACRHDYEVQAGYGPCPACGNWLTETLHGQELELVSLELGSE